MLVEMLVLVSCSLTHTLMTLYFVISHLIWTYERLLGTTWGLGVSHLLCLPGVSNNVWIFPGCRWCRCSKLASSLNILVFLEGFRHSCNRKRLSKHQMAHGNESRWQIFPRVQDVSGRWRRWRRRVTSTRGSVRSGVKRFAVGLRLESCWWCVFDEWHGGGSNGWEWLILILGGRQSGSSLREKSCLD